MRRTLLKTIIAVSCVAVFAACTKEDLKETWQVHNYCEPLRPGVICAQDDTLQETYSKGQYQVGQTIVVSQDQNIIYYKHFITIVNTY